MPGGLWYTFRQGNRTEYLATYLLSALGIAVKVPREEDVGIDFHCNLASDFGDGLLRFFAPYNVQIKASSEEGISIKYGGIKNGKCKDHEVRWLLSQRTPLFLGVVDKGAGVIRLYSMANRWFAKYEEQVPCELEFVTDTPAAGEEIKMEAVEKSDLEHESIPAGVAHSSWRIPIGPPAMTLSVDEAEDACCLLNRRNHFKDFIYSDESNGVFSGIGLPCFSWPLWIQPNLCLMEQGVAVGWGKKITHDETRQMRVLAPLVASLQRTYVNAGKSEAAKQLGGLLSVIPDTDEYRLVRDIIRDSNTMVKQAGSTGGPSLSAQPM